MLHFLETTVPLVAIKLLPSSIKARHIAQFNSIYWPFFKSLLHDRLCVRCFTCIISLNPCSFLFLIKYMRKPRLGEKKSPVLEYFQIYSLPSWLSPPDASHCCSIPSQLLLRWEDVLPANFKTQSYLHFASGDSAHFIASFPPWETGEEKAHRIMSFGSSPCGSAV